MQNCLPLKTLPPFPVPAIPPSQLHLLAIMNKDIRQQRRLPDERLLLLQLVSTLTTEWSEAIMAPSTLERGPPVQCPSKIQRSSGDI
jgi:hypothetical protein